jgi:methyl-accepting chemotaxis protein
MEKFGFSLDQILLVLTTAVSLEAIYLAIFIQMTVNRQETRLHEVGEDIDEIHEDVEELGKDIDEIQEDLGEISEDVDDISKDVDELSEEEDGEAADRERLQKIEESLKALVAELAELRTRK